MDKGNPDDVEIPPSDQKNKIQIKTENISSMLANAENIKDQPPSAQ